MYMDWKPEKDTDSGKILSEFVAQAVFDRFWVVK